MGSDWIPNQALSVELMLDVLKYVDSNMWEANLAIDLNRWVVTHAYITLGNVLSLRGTKTFSLI